MKRRTIIVTLALVVASVAALPVAGLAATDGTVAAADGNATATNGTAENATIAPGQRLSGVVGIGEAELDGEIDSRAFGLRVASAVTENASAEVVAQQFGDIRERLERFEQRKQALDRARENGSMRHGHYAAEVSELAARTETVKHLANRSELVARGLPEALLEERGINVTAIRTLRMHADEMTGPEVAEMARRIAGHGHAPGQRGPGMAGPGDRPGQQGPATSPGQHGPDAGPGQHGTDRGPGQHGPAAGSGGDGTETAVTDGGTNATATPRTAGDHRGGHQSGGN